MKIKQIVDRLRKFDYYHPFEFRGCTDSQIEELEKLLPGNYKLPKVYKEMLAEIGIRAGQYRVDEDFYYRAVLHAAQTNLIGHWTPTLKDSYDGELDLSDALIISYYNDHYCMFIKLSEGDNPHPYFYHGDDHACTKNSATLLEVLDATVEGHVEHRKEFQSDFPHVFQPVKRFKDTLSKVIQWTVDALDNSPTPEQLTKVNKLKNRIVNAHCLERGIDELDFILDSRGIVITDEQIQYFAALNPVNSDLVKQHLTAAKKFVESRVRDTPKPAGFDVFREDPDLLSDIHQTLVNRNIIFKGLSKSELEKHLKQFGNRTFPKAYIEFLELFGKEIQGFDDKYKLLYPLSELFDYESYLENVLQAQFEEEYIPSSYYPKMIVFARKGEKIAFFILNDEGDDPPVYRYEYYEDYTEECVQESPHFSTYLMKILTKGMQ